MNIYEFLYTELLVLLN